MPTATSSLLARLRELNREVFKQYLDRFLTVEQLEALETRRASIVRRFDDQIAWRGAAAVLYDLPRRQ